MSSSRSKVVELKGVNYQVRKLPPDVGSFVFMRLMGIQMRMMQERAEQELAAKIKRSSAQQEQVVEEPDVEEPKPVKVDGDMRVRAMVFTVFSGGIPFEDFQFIQTACMKSVSKANEEGRYMPVMSDGGVWTKDGEEVRDSFDLLMQLTTDVLVFCFASFFAESGPGL